MQRRVRYHWQELLQVSFLLRQRLNLPYEDRLCTKCLSADVGDEFHYVFSCPFFFFFFFFAESRKEKKKSPFYCKNANVNRFHSLFCSKKKRLLVNLAHFMKFIMSEF